MKSLPILLLVAGALLFAGAVTVQFPAEFYQDFRDAKSPTPLFKKSTQGDTDNIKFEPEGLRITVPVNELPNPRAGVVSKFRVVGNFEITASFELLQTGAKARGWGAGPVLQILKDPTAPFPQGAAVCRFVNPINGNVFGASRGPAEAGDKPDIKFFPNDTKTGKLRLVRNGSTLTWQFAAGQSDVFGEIRQEEFGPQEVTVRLVADPGRGPGGTGSADCRFLDLRIRADALPGAINIVSNQGVKHTWWIAGGIGGILLLVGTAWAFRRSRRLVATVKTAATSEKEPISAGVSSPRSTTSAETAKRSEKGNLPPDPGKSPG